ncbi:MAG: STAS domain-containing protein [Kibdelosporangium sp.]
MSDNSLFSWHVTEQTAAVVVEVAGEIDLASEEDFAVVLEQALDGSAPVILVDLSGVTFLGSAALHVLLEANRDAGRQRREFRVAHGGSFAARVLEVAGLNQVLAVFQTAELALRSASGDAADSRHEFGVRDAL